MTTMRCWRCLRKTPLLMTANFSGVNERGYKQNISGVSSFGILLQYHSHSRETLLASLLHFWKDCLHWLCSRRDTRRVWSGHYVCNNASVCDYAFTYSRSVQRRDFYGSYVSLIVYTGTNNVVPKAFYTHRVDGAFTVNDQRILIVRERPNNSSQRRQWGILGNHYLRFYALIAYHISKLRQLFRQSLINLVSIQSLNISRRFKSIQSLL